MGKVWGRRVKVLFKSIINGRQIVIDSAKDNSPKIEITGKKYLSPVKDEFVIAIYNLTYSEISKLMLGQFFGIEIYAGYESLNIHRIFNGQVLYISNEQETRETNVVYILCISNLMGLYTSKLSFTMNSGMNMYACMDYISRRAGIPNSNVSEELRRRITADLTSCNGQAASIISTFANAAGMATQGDSSNNNAGVSMFPWGGNNRRVKMTPESGTIINGRPKLTTDGLTLTSFPIYNFVCGDTLLIDNKYIDMSIKTVSEAKSTNIGQYIDKEGEYLLWEMSYTLSTTDGPFQVELKARAKSLMSNITGGSTNE